MEPEKRQKSRNKTAVDRRRKGMVQGMEKIRVIIDNTQKEVKIPTGMRMLVRRCCNAVLRMENFPYPAEISVTFVNNKQIHELNRQYRDRDMPTDVLSFPMGENGVYDENHDTGAKILGDIVISMEKAVEQANRYGHSLEREVGYLTAHSMLHLLGYDHETSALDKMHMREKEERVMTQLGLPGSAASYFMDDDD
jgi:probable rRNA maturation factor